MTEKEMLARIAQLEKENAALRRNLKSGRRCTWTKKMEDILPRDIVDADKLSYAVRKACFEPDIQDWFANRINHRTKKVDCVKRPSLMSDEEYIRYEEIMCEVLTVLRKYADGPVDLSALVTESNTL